jgi:oligopeptide/dipeptide ABC transporter ATP-binding protein
VSALPIADPATERQRRRVILTGDIPSPITPPSGCRFHTRCWLYAELGEPERCRTTDPVLTPTATGGMAACHFQDALATSPVGRVDTSRTVTRSYPSAPTTIGMAATTALDPIAPAGGLRP